MFQKCVKLFLVFLAPVILCNGCLSFFTYHSIPKGEIDDTVRLGPPSSYKIESFNHESRRGEKYMMVYLDAESFWSTISLGLSTTESRGDQYLDYQKAAEMGSSGARVFPPPIYEQDSVHVLGGSGLLVNLSNVRWTCPALAQAAHEKHLFINARDATVSGTLRGVEFQESEGRAYLRVRSNDTKLLHLDCSRWAPPNGLAYFTRDSEPSQTLSDQWQSVSAREFDPKSHFIVILENGPAYVYELQDLPGYHGPRLLFIYSNVRRRVRFYDRTTALWLPLTLAVDIVTAPISIPLLFIALAGLERGH